MFSYRTLDDAGNPARVRWVWLVPRRPAGEPGGSGWRRLPEYAMPPLLVLGALVGWLFLLKSQGPFVLAVTLFSPISSTLIFVCIAFGLWMLRCLSRHAGRCRSAALALGRCPVCSYSLANLGRSGGAEETLVRCPECGTTWNLSASRDALELVRVADPKGGADAGVEAAVERM